MKLLKALEDRNRCLKNIADYSQSFLQHFQTENFDHLDEFENFRKKSLKILMLFDNYIKTLLPKITSDKVIKLKIQHLLDESEKLKTNIINIDNIISTSIELEKSRLLKKLGLEEQNKKMLSKFRSETAFRSGGKLDGIL